MNQNQKLTPIVSRSIKPKRIFAFDTEDNSKGKLIMIVVFDGKRYHTFGDTESCIDYMFNLCGETGEAGPFYFFALNLEYDLVNIFRNNFELLDITYSRSFIIKARLKTTNVYFYDVLNHTALSVAAIGKLLGFDKLPHDPYSVKYCKRDTQIVYKWARHLQKFYEGIGCEFKSTAPATSLDLFRRRYLAYSVSTSKSELREDLQSAYYGGRTEVFFNSPIDCKNGSRIYYTDFNSLYPYCMAGNNYPNPNVVRRTGENHLPDNGIVCADVSVKNMFLPILPKRHNKKLIFPIGRFTGVWTIPEFKYAMENGYTCEKINWGIDYVWADDYFSEYVNDLYAKRLAADKRGNHIEKEFIKLMMNSLYGKFAQSNLVFKLVNDPTAGLFMFGNQVIAPRYTQYPANSNIIWSAYIVAYARIHLHKAMMEVLHKGGKLVYCDTDSIVYVANKSLIKTGKNLGQLKLEGKYTKGYFKLPKLYMLQNGKKSFYVAKGVRQVNAEEFFVQGETTFERPTRLREAIRSGIVPNVWSEHTKKSRQKYDKRKVSKNGETIPIVLNQIDIDDSESAFNRFNKTGK